MSSAGRRVAPAVALAVDVVLVLAFATVGRRNHEEAGTVLGTLDTAWPFLAGLGVAWLASRAWRHPVRSRPEALVIWTGTVAVGMGLRALTGQGTAVSFVVVAAVVLAVFLLGWRTLARRLVHRPTRR